MAGSSELSYCADLVRRHDRDRFLTVLFAPAERREALFALYAFNVEVAKTRESVSEAPLGAIRLQWWREAIEEAFGRDTVRRHAVVRPLTVAIREHGLSRVHFDRLIDARMADLEDAPPPSMGVLEAYAEGTAASLVWSAIEILMGEPSDAAQAVGRSVGLAWAYVGLLRAMPHHLRQGRVYLPDELAERHGVRRRDLLDLKPSGALAAAVGELASRARDELARARASRAGVPAAARPAFYQASLVDGYLRRLAGCGYDVFDPRLALAPALQIPRLAFRAFAGRY